MHAETRGSGSAHSSFVLRFILYVYFYYLKIILLFKNFYTAYLYFDHILFPLSSPLSFSPPSLPTTFLFFFVSKTKQN